jgi:hypothetical protein
MGDERRAFRFRHDAMMIVCFCSHTVGRSTSSDYKNGVPALFLLGHDRRVADPYAHPFHPRFSSETEGEMVGRRSGRRKRLRAHPSRPSFSSEGKER